MIKDLYDQNAHYLPDDSPAIHGVDALATYWQGSFELMKGLKLNMETLEGINDLLYETGITIAQIML